MRDVPSLYRRRRSGRKSIELVDLRLIHHIGGCKHGQRVAIPGFLRVHKQWVIEALLRPLRGRKHAILALNELEAFLWGTLCVLSSTTVGVGEELLLDTWTH